MSLVEIAREALALQAMAIKLKEQRDGLIDSLHVILAHANVYAIKPEVAIVKMVKVADDAVKRYSETVTVERR